ncbi:MAG: AMP-binding protein [Clostridia bacterium]|nr:AMP-binding protein [Clostridia bacterium]
MKKKIVENFVNVRQIINNSAKKYADSNAFIIKNKKDGKETYYNITFKRFKQDIDAFGTSLLELGLKGKRVAIIGKNRYEWAVSYFAVLNGVGIVIPLDKGLPEQEIEELLQRSRADVIIFSKEYEETMDRLIEKKTTGVKIFINMDGLSGKKYIYYSKLIKQGKEQIKNGNLKYLMEQIDNDGMSVILFTSGTTSISKAVMLSHRNIASNVYALREKEDIYNRDVNMAFLPFHHTFGSTGLLFFLSEGACTVFCDGLRHIQKNLKEYKVSVFFCVPLIIEAMHKKLMSGIEKKGKSKSFKIAMSLGKVLYFFGIDIRRKLFKDVINELGGNIRFIISGAASINKNAAKSFNDMGILTVQGYGLTETAPTLAAENKCTIEYGSVGRPMCNVKLKIDNPNEKGIGEIIVKGPNIMLGYYENEEATNDVLKNGWFYTGDLGYISKKGNLFIKGRKKSVIVLKNGKNVYPEELEILVAKLPYVAENIVFGIEKDGDFELNCKMVYNMDVVRDIFGDVSDNELRESVWEDIKKINKTLSNYKHIKNVILTNEPMEKTTTGKVKRKSVELLTNLP